jgi:hypothetical protein
MARRTLKPSEHIRDYPRLYDLSCEWERKLQFDATSDDEKKLLRQTWREEGRLIQASHLLLSLGAEKLEAPDTTTVSAIAGMDDVAELEHLLRRLLTVDTWQELLAQES